MLNPSILLPFLIFAVVMTGTPGPNNTMVMMCGARAGVLRSIPLVSGIALGVGLQFAVLGLGLGAFFEAMPDFHLALGALGASYILWLAWKIATSGPFAPLQDDRPPMGLLGGAAFQWINPKAWALTISAATTYIPDQNHIANLWIAAVLLAAVSVPCVGVWAVAGAGLRQVLTRPNVALTFNMSMSVLLILATLPALLRLITQH